MQNTMTKYKFFLNFEKEEAWLEQMSAQGWHLVRVTSLGGYIFSRGIPEERIYKIDFRKFNRKQDMDDYVTLFTDSGWQCVAPRLSAYNYYFYTSKDGARKDIFSDSDSRVQRYHRYAVYMGGSMVISLLPYMALYASGAFKVQEFGYQTPGLWQMTGSEFVFHFLFETPFVVARSVIGFLPLILMLVGLFFIARVTLLSRKKQPGS